MEGAVGVRQRRLLVEVDDGTAVHELDVGVWQRVLAINLTSYFLFAKFALPRMLDAAAADDDDGASAARRREKVIINMASVQGRQSQAGIPAYAASKGGVLLVAGSPVGAVRALPAGGGEAVHDDARGADQPERPQLWSPGLRPARG